MSDSDTSPRPTHASSELSTAVHIMGEPLFVWGAKELNYTRPTKKRTHTKRNQTQTPKSTKTTTKANKPTMAIYCCTKTQPRQCNALHVKGPHWNTMHSFSCYAVFGFPLLFCFFFFFRTRHVQMHVQLKLRARLFVLESSTRATFDSEVFLALWVQAPSKEVL